MHGKMFIFLQDKAVSGSGIALVNKTLEKGTAYCYVYTFNKGWMWQLRKVSTLEEAGQTDRERWK